MLHILVVDDEDLVRRPLCRFLRNLGYRVTEAANGRDGLEQLESASPDMIITDIIMPDGEGLELIRKARQRQPQVPIIAISAGLIGCPMNVLEVAEKLGAAAVLDKPFEYAHLKKLVHQHAPAL